ncbi:hypothetical protein JCM10914A_05420 [Paenibacillus sp. JCM 10914]|uniref:peptidylprolyl isomerase n=1 Tax=Paenibacillus sp. JCM 10914 TaxID=1236974 RepID=UPI0003CC688B|nr:peptidylprolyl isomerase [Paenibacillus sp. JCM 10914]GAE07029.1 hypothetical protein JCM10914_3233 [Paenibacillus sp. JCM 10914]
MSLLEANALVIDGEAVEFREVLRFAKHPHLAHILQLKARQKVIERYALEAGISVAGEELQLGVDRFRRENDLLRVADVNEWLERHYMTLDDLADRVHAELIEAKVAAHVSLPLIEPYFYEHRLSFDSAVISRIVMKEYGASRELLFRIEEGDDFYTLARRYSVEEETKAAGGYVGEVTRVDLTPAVSAAVFGATMGEILGPIETKQGFLLVKVEAIASAQLNESVREQIQSIVFEQWVDAKWTAAGFEYPIMEQI